MKRIVWNVLVGNQLPDVFLGPIGQRTDLHQLELLVPTDDWCPSPVGTLIATNGAGPGMFANDRAVEQLDLPLEAANIGLSRVERSVVLRLEFGNRQLRLHQLDLNAVAANHFFP